MDIHILYLPKCSQIHSRIDHTPISFDGVRGSAGDSGNVAGIWLVVFKQRRQMNI